MDVERTLHDLGHELPEPAESKGVYEPITVTSREVFVSGQLPLRDGELASEGRVAEDVSVEEAREAAELCGLNALALMHRENVLDEVVISRVEGYVAAPPGFHDHPAVVNGASELLVEVLGDRGRHARIAVGSPSLPLDAPVEVSLEGYI